MEPHRECLREATVVASLLNPCRVAASPGNGSLLEADHVFPTVQLQQLPGTGNHYQIRHRAAKIVVRRVFFEIMIDVIDFTHVRSFLR